MADKNGLNQIRNISTLTVHRWHCGQILLISRVFILKSIIKIKNGKTEFSFIVIVVVSVPPEAFKFFSDVPAI